MYSPGALLRQALIACIIAAQVLGFTQIFDACKLVMVSDIDAFVTAAV